MLICWLPASLLVYKSKKPHGVKTMGLRVALRFFD
ncbi:hypothetical protein HAL1_08827 [Halomonas sp. HAL1]|nr:hypothetical protein HAL1_08827 [Halomonas sp. HAL1]